MPLAVDGQLRPLPEELARVRAAMRGAADAGDFRRAALLQDLLNVAQPKPPLSVEECSPADPDDALDFFLREGFRWPRAVVSSRTFLRDHFRKDSLYRDEPKSAR